MVFFLLRQHCLLFPSRQNLHPNHRLNFPSKHLMDMIQYFMPNYTNCRNKRRKGKKIKLRERNECDCIKAITISRVISCVCVCVCANKVKLKSKENRFVAYIYFSTNFFFISLLFSLLLLLKHYYDSKMLHTHTSCSINTLHFHGSY